MIRNILVPVSGTAGDDPVFETAWSAASALQAHIEFVHLRVSPGEAAIYTPHADFAQGAALTATLAELAAERDKRSIAAHKNVEAFCKVKQIELTGVPPRCPGVSAYFTEERDGAVEQLEFRARHSDLVVCGRPRSHNGLPSDLIDRLLTTAGRPLILPGTKGPTSFPGTVMICWRETPEAARAVTAAMPILMAAKRVVVATVERDEIQGGTGPEELAESLSWHGIAAEPVIVPLCDRSVYAALSAAAQACSADLLVMGAYGHWPMRELVFGGPTRSTLEDADLPVFMMH